LIVGNQNVHTAGKRALGNKKKIYIGFYIKPQPRRHVWDAKKIKTTFKNTANTQVNMYFFIIVTR